jgi:hypothetical protein
VGDDRAGDLDELSQNALATRLAEKLASIKRAQQGG